MLRSKPIILVILLISLVYSLNIVGVKVTHNVKYKQFNCDMFETNKLGHRVIWYVQNTDPYPVLFIRVDNPSGKIWRLYNMEELKQYGK